MFEIRELNNLRNQCWAIRKNETEWNGIDFSNISFWNYKWKMMRLTLYDSITKSDVKKSWTTQEKWMKTESKANKVIWIMCQKIVCCDFDFFTNTWMDDNTTHTELFDLVLCHWDNNECGWIPLMNSNCQLKKNIQLHLRRWWQSICGLFV